MRQFLVIIETGEQNLSAYSPDLPGCVATGATYDEVLKNMYEAIQMHLEAMVEEGETIPETFSLATHIAVPEPPVMARHRVSV
ncbi:MAG: type II toxin-antitoxin system HicB family antitoxin [Chloroflexi bacterium]|nr:type II toxin-antitoxin system HicB family antitoxin [Chloroflexota bacterium]